MASPVSTNAILANLSPTLFQAGPKDIVATPDIYTLTSSTLNSGATVNTAVGKYNPFDTSLVNNLKAGAVGVLASLTSLASLGALGSVAASLVNTGTVARLGAAAGLPVSALSPTFQSGLSSAVNLNAGHYSQLLVTSEGTTQAITTGDYATTQQALGLVNQLSGNSSLVSVVDTGAQASVASVVTSNLIALGLSGVLGSFIASQSPTYTLQPNGTPSPTVAQMALSQNVLKAIQASDLTTLQLCITQLGVGGVLAQVPDAAVQLVQHYAIPRGAAASTYGALWTALQSLLVQLAPSWKTTLRNGTVIPSLVYYQAASTDCRTLMATDSDAQVLAGQAIGPTFSTEAALATLSAMYPQMLKL